MYTNIERWTLKKIYTFGKATINSVLVSSKTKQIYQNCNQAQHQQ